LDRKEAITLLIEDTIQSMTNNERFNELLNWWGIDEEDEIFNNLPDVLRHEILNSNEPPVNCMDEIYNSLIREALRHTYIGVRNDYLEKRISMIFNVTHRVVGMQETLLPCPCCRFKTLMIRGEYDICPVCYWEDDGINDLNEYSSPNHMTLAQGIENFTKLGAISESLSKTLEADRFDKYRK
jgi:hypothetical protein